VLPAIELGIPIGVRNTLNPANPCTLISAHEPRVRYQTGSTAVARLRTVTSVSVLDYEARHKMTLDVDWRGVLPRELAGKHEAGLVALVGTGASALSRALQSRVESILSAAGVQGCTPLPVAVDPHALVFVVPDAQRKVAVRALHAAFASEFDQDLPLEPEASGSV
jgi:aspartokinase